MREPEETDAPEAQQRRRGTPDWDETPAESARNDDRYWDAKYDNDEPREGS